LGTLTTTGGNRVVLAAAGTPVTGTLRAQVQCVSGISGVSNVSVQQILYKQSYNVYSDLGVGGSIGVSTGPAEATATFMKLENIAAADAPEPPTVMRASYTLENFRATPDSFAGWFVEEGLGNRYMRYYHEPESGYLHFFVKTN